MSQPTTNEPTTKELYLNIREASSKDSLQSNWGRVQQKDETEYEQLLEEIAAKRGFALAAEEAEEDKQVLEEFTGLVDHVDGAVAYVTLTAKETGEVLLGEYPTAKLARLGIRERRRFKCKTVSFGGSVKVEMEAIPDREISAEEEREIKDETRKLLGDDDDARDEG